MNTILVVDDEKNLRYLLKNALASEHAEIFTASTGIEALEKIDEIIPDLILLDLILPDINGIQILKRIKKKYPEIIIIIMTAFEEVRSAVEAMKNQAYDYICKPFDVEEIRLIVHRALENATVRRDYQRLRQMEEVKCRTDQIIGESTSTIELRRMMIQIARSEARTILLMGESGTGKELVARGLHYECFRNAD